MAARVLPEAAPVEQKAEGVSQTGKARPTFMAQTTTKVHVAEREVVIAHMAAALGRAPRLFSAPPRHLQELVDAYGRFAENGLTDAAAVEDFRALYDETAFDETDNPHLITMETAGLSLFHFWNAESARFDEQDKRSLLVQEMMRAMWSVHRGGILQGDPHVGNVCLAETEDGGIRATMIDFGRSHFVGRNNRRSSSMAFLPELVNERVSFLSNILVFISTERLRERLGFTVSLPPEEWPGATSEKPPVATEEQEEEETRCCVLCRTAESHKWYMCDNVCHSCFERGKRYYDDREKLEKYYDAEDVTAYLTLAATLPRTRRPSAVATEQQQDEEEEELFDPPPTPLPCKRLLSEPSLREEKRARASSFSSDVLVPPADASPPV